MKVSRPFFAHKPWSGDGLDHAALVSGGWLDGDGWAKEMPPGMGAIATIWDWGGTGSDAALRASRAGVYVLHYKGEGTVKMGLDAQVISSKPGEIIFRNVNGASMVLEITSTDPHHTGDYIRDITMVRQEYQALYDVGEIFNPAWLSLVQNARELRFMDWMHTNGTISADWPGRAEPGDVSYMQKGAPLEVMVALANQTGTDPWFNMPAGASEEYIRNFATYVRDHLNAGLKAHVEYSNETWNWSFAQTQWMNTQAMSTWGVASGEGGLDYYAMLATKSALIWDGVFGASAETRVVNVLGTQAGNPWVAGRLLDAPLWKTNDPSGYVAPGSVFDSLAIATYFGGASMGEPALRAELLAMIKDHPDTVSAWLTSKLLDPSYTQSIPQVASWWQANKVVADKYGLDLVAYEGGQHLLHSFSVAGLTEADLAVLTTFLTAYINSPAMAILYQSYWTAWAKVSDGPFMQFGEVGQASKWGAWGLYNSLGDHNPRADLLASLNATQASWFGDGGGVQYQQGVIKLAGDKGGAVTGSALDDFLIGGKGADIFTPGAGQDAISGQGGRDTLILNGKPVDYTVVMDGGTQDGLIRLTGHGSSYLVKGIEIFKFDGGVVRYVDQLLPGLNTPTGPSLGLATLGARLDASAVELVSVNGVRGVTITGIAPDSTLGQQLGLDSGVQASPTAGNSGTGSSGTGSFGGPPAPGAYQIGATLADNLTVALAHGSVVTGVKALRATVAADIFNGLGADDIVFGMGGSDKLSGGAGNDWLYGGAGNDTITGGAGQDVLRGGDGVDVFVFAPGSGADLVMDFTPRDKLNLTAFHLGTRAALTAAAGVDVAGDLTLTFGADVLTLHGLQAGDISWVLATL